MPIIKSATKPTDVVYDAWGNVIRGDWREVPGMTYEPGQAHLWDISGETHAAGEAPVAAGSPSLMAGYTGGQALIQQALGDPLFRSGTRSYAAGAPGVQSVNAYNNSLLAQGINPSELPYGQGGQIATARVQAQHGLPIADWLQPFLARALAGPTPVAGTTVGGQTGPLWDTVYSPGEGPDMTAAVAAARPTTFGAPDVFGPLANANPNTLLNSLIQYPAISNANAASLVAPKQTSLYQAMRDAILKRFAAPTALARPV